MTADPATIDPAEAMLAELAGLDLSLARHVHACAMSTDDPDEVAALARAYQRIARSTRQSLALHARFKRERERGETPPAPPPPPPPPPRDEARIAERRAAVRRPLQRLIWTEYERPETEELAFAFERLDQHLARGAEDPAFGLVARDDAWEVETLDAHVASLARDLGLCPLTARRWRDLPDPPARDQFANSG